MKHFLLAFLVACGGAASSSAPQTPAGGPGTAPTVADGVGPVDGEAQSADGLKIAYDVRGKGSDTLVFIHGFLGDRRAWKNQVEAFALDHRVVTLDLGGHGKSGIERKEWTIASLGGDVKAVVEALKLDHVILVGHSMGGPVALSAAAQLPGKVRAVVCADTLQNVEMTPPPGVADQLIGALKADFPGTIRQLMAALAGPNIDPALMALIGDTAAAANKDVALALFPAVLNTDGKGLLAAAKVPVRCINAAERPPFGPKTTIEINRKYGDYDAVIIEGVGHFVQLEKPEEFNRDLRETLAKLAK